MTKPMSALVQPVPPRPWWRQPWWWAAGAAFLVRLGMIFYDAHWLLNPVRPFMIGWETGAVAGSVALGHGFHSPFGVESGPTAWVSPIYVYLCALVFRIFGVYTLASHFTMLLINSILSALTCVPIYHVGRRTLGARVALVSAWAWALLPHFGKWAATVVWETSLSALLLVLLILLALRAEEEPTTPRRWMALGFWIGIAALVNPALATFGPVFGIWAWLRLRATPRFWRNAMAGAALCALTISPWIVRNRIVFGHWVFLRSNFGFEFHLGNYHLSNGLGWFGLHPTQNKAEMAKFLQMGEIAYIADAQRQALGFVRQYPGEFAALTARRFAMFWNGEPMLYSPTPEPWIPATYFAVSLMAGFGWLWAATRRVRGFLLLTYPLLYGLPYYIAYPHPRYRHAIEPEMVLLGTYLLAMLAEPVRAAMRSRSAAAALDSSPARVET